MKKYVLKLFIIFIILSIVLPCTPVFAYAEYTLDIANTDMSYTNVDSFSTYETAYKAFSSSAERDIVIRNSSGKVIAMKEGMAVTDSYSSTLSFLAAYNNGISGYCQNGIVCYYISTDENQLVTISVSSYKGVCNVDDVKLIPSAFTYPRNTTERPLRYEFDYYLVEDGDLIHKICHYNYSTDGTNLYAYTLDKAPSFMTENIRYYSIDGYSFYTDPYDAVFERNCVGTYYIYFRYLSFRSQTNYTEDELNSYISYRNSTYNTSTDCVYLDEASAFLQAQHKYGVNAVLEIAFANLESAYGKSYIAVDKNNIFGMNAVDSDPYDSADKFKSVAACIAEHAKYTLNRGYFDAYFYYDSAKGASYYNVSDRYDGWVNSYSGDSRYFGTCTGNKAIGINVKYASDPWHGDKIASHAYMLDKYLGSKDYGKYTIGVTNSLTYAYSEANTDAFALYKYTSKDPGRDYGSYSYGPIGMPVIILGEVGNYYMVQAEMPMNSDKRSCNSWDYDFELSKAYVLKENIDIIYTSGDTPVSPEDITNVTSSKYSINSSDKSVGKIYEKTSVDDFKAAFSNGSVKVYQNGSEVKDGFVATGMSIKFYESDGNYSTTYTAVVLGDVNGDGKISVTDIVKLSRHLAVIDTLSGVYLDAADVNMNGKVTSTDIVQLARHIAGIKTIGAGNE